jgi:hypothetical protein
MSKTITTLAVRLAQTFPMTYLRLESLYIGLRLDKFS